MSRTHRIADKALEAIGRCGTMFATLDEPLADPKSPKQALDELWESWMDFRRDLAYARAEIPLEVKNAMKLAIKIPLAVSLLLWEGFVISMLWVWFLVPLGAPDIALFHAVGLSVMWRFLLWRGRDTEPLWEDVPRYIALSLLALALGSFFARWV